MPPLPVVAGYVLLVLLWGSTWAAIKIGVEAVPPFVFAFERAVVVSLILTGLSLALRQRFPREGRVIVATILVGVINTGSSWAIIFWSEQYVPSGLVAVFGAAGIAILVGAPNTGSRPEALLAGVLLAIMPITWAVATILQVRVLHQGSPLPLVAVGTWAGSLVLLPLAFAQSGDPSRWGSEAAIAMAYLVVFGSCVGLVLQMWLTRKLRPTTMTLGQVVISAQALLVGAIALGETVTWRMLAGAALVAIAVALNAIAGGGARAAAATAASPADQAIRLSLLPPAGRR